MRLLKTHSHTSERLGYEAEKELQVKREKKRAYPKRRENVNGNHRHVTWKGRGGAQTCRRKAKTQRIAITAARGGEAKWYHRKGEKSHSPVPKSAWQNYLERPPAPAGGGRQDEKETNPVPQ